jgi:hypothetical protein
MYHVFISMGTLITDGTGINVAAGLRPEGNSGLVCTLGGVQDEASRKQKSIV